jgi:hypothetical protein
MKLRSQAHFKNPPAKFTHRFTAIHARFYGLGDAHPQHGMPRCARLIMLR